MPRTDRHALAVVSDVAAAQHGLITAAQLAEIGYGSSSIRHHSRQGGPWTRVLPAVYSVMAGPLDDDRRRRAAALLYVGEPAAHTGRTALALHAVRGARAAGDVHVLIPHERRRVGHAFVRVERTTTWPEPILVAGEPVVPLPRAAIDACRTMRRAGDVRALLAGLVQSDRCSVDTLEAELRIAQRRGTALAREALMLIRAGGRSAPELDLVELWTASGLPDAVWNADLLTPSGQFIARPDVYVPHAGVAVEVDSREHHFGVDDWERTMRRDARLTARGVLVLHVTPARMRAEWSRVADEAHRAIASRAGQPAPNVLVVPQRAA